MTENAVMSPQLEQNDASDALLRVRNVTRTFGSVTGLVGDNGAGKSTIIKIISGMFPQSSGDIVFDGTPRHWSSPQQALGAGIETVYQDVGLAASLSITANIFLGRELVRPGLLGRMGFLNNSEMARIAQQDTAKTMSWARKLLILDEPTNHLGVHEVEELLRLIRHVRDEGVAVILISHTLAHIMAITDRIVVMRLGQAVAEHRTRETTTSAVVNDIVGATEAEIARSIN
jgi:simple sugar transport system ATP-binding protein